MKQLEGWSVKSLKSENSGNTYIVISDLHDFKP